MTSTPIPDPVADRRCQRGPDCAQRDLVRADHGDAPDPTEWRAVLLDDPHRVWCDRCRGRLYRALHTIPGMLATLGLAVVPRVSARYDAASSPGGLDHSPVPLDLTADAVARLLDHEITTWSDAVARTAGLVATGEWSTDPPTPTDPPGLQHLRITQGCQLLATRLGQWITAGPLTYEARSLLTDPTARHDPDTLSTAPDGTVHCTRPGAAAAAAVLAVFRSLEYAQAAKPRDPRTPERVREACPHCAARQVHRHHYIAVYWCHGCGKQWHEDRHLDVLQTLLRLHAAPEATAA